MAVTRYLQLYGIQDVSIYSFSAIAPEFIQELVESECKECFLANYNQLGVYVSAINDNKYFVVVAVKGGYGAQQKNLNESQIEELVKVIELNR
jgi:hypothetical protein